MESMPYAGPVEVVVLRLDAGENVLGSIRRAVAEHDIRNGAVVSGVATFRRCQMHYVEHSEFPPENTFHTVERPLEVGSVSGVIASGEPHLHVVVGHRDEEVWAGHLEEDSVVGYLAEICILKFNGLEMERRPDAERELRLLGPRKGA